MAGSKHDHGFLKLDGVAPFEADLPDASPPLGTSLLRRLQAQILPVANPPVGKIHPFSKVSVTFEPIQ